MPDEPRSEDTQNTAAENAAEPQTDPPEGDPMGGDPGETEPDTFPRSYVEELHQENGKYRQRAQKAENYAQRLHTELVRATGKLADPTDLPFSEDHLDDPDALATAVDELLQRKPHLASRRPSGEIGQGASPSPATFDLAALLRQRAR